jgi:hypothetical protein
MFGISPLNTSKMNWTYNIHVNDAYMHVPNMNREYRHHTQIFVLKACDYEMYLKIKI